MKSRSQMMQEIIEKKEYEHNLRLTMRGILDNLLEDDKFTRVRHIYDDEDKREKLIDKAKWHMEDWELEDTDENIIEALTEKIWEEN